MSRIDAIYQDGVFKPLSPICLPDNQRVSLTVEATTQADMLRWLEESRELKRRMTESHGLLPDSTPGIAADRLR